MRTFLATVLTGVVSALGANSIPAQNNFTMLEHTVAGGGTASRGGGFALTGTIGQSLTCSLRGGGFTLAGGFWGAAIAVQQAGMPWLTVTKTPNQATVSWPITDGESEIVLEASPVLGAASYWSVVVLRRDGVGGQNRVHLPANLGNRFFRLRRPDLIP